MAVASGSPNFRDGGAPAGPAPGCQLLSSSFGWWLQVFLGAVCFVSLVAKRFTDKVRRPWKVWFFDTSKQGISAVLIHFLNILLSMAFGEWLDVKADPCNWYWINLTLDDTIGVGILFLLLRLLQCTYRARCIGRPELALSGEYGEPPDVRIFSRQLLDWQLLVVVEKILLAVFVVNFTGSVAAVAGVLLGWLDPYPRVKLVVVMVVSPLVMNVFALWAADSFLQGDAAKPLDMQARQSLVRGSPRIVGQSEGGSSTSSQEEDAEDSEQIVGFQKWKQLQEWRGRGASSAGAELVPSRPTGVELTGTGSAGARRLS